MFHQRPLHGVGPSLSLRSNTDRSTTKLCEKGRAYITDPSTGQLVCLCQLETHPAHSLQSHPALRGLQAVPTTRSAFGDVHNYRIQLSAMTPLTEPANGLLSSHIAFHPYSTMYAGLDVNGGPIRKAATRETTGPLKIWLSEHKKNPYPTKAEKIMLAIITRMTLTQVSTWFANARRRLKKDNRLSPGTGEEDSVGIDSDREGDAESTSMGVSVDVDKEVQVALRTEVPLSSEGEAEPDSFSDISDEENDVFKPQSLGSPKTASRTRLPVITSSAAVCQQGACPPVLPDKSLATPSETLPACQSSRTPKPKPKIWSISHILDS